MELLLKRIFVHKTQNSYVQFFRYFFASGIALIFDFGGLVLLKQAFRFNYLIAASISFVAGLIVNYLMSAFWVFHSSKLRKRHELVVFTVTGLVGLGLTDLILWGLTSGFGIYYIFSKAIATVIVYFWNFGSRKKFIFR
jgi:putative flippase GtrA